MLIAQGDISAGSKINPAGISADCWTIAVIIPTFNNAHFLAEAIRSVLNQTRPADQIIVVDDGSSDDPAAVVAHFENVRLIRQDNRGPSSARNTGLRHCNTSHVVFLDSDDRLLPRALEAGLACSANRPECGFVYGGYRRVSIDGGALESDCLNPIKGDAHLALLRANVIGPPMVGLYRRDCLTAMNGFDETLRRAEDYDLYLRISEKYPIINHWEIVAEYRRHSDNVSNNFPEQLKAVYRVLDKHEARIKPGSTERAALREGRGNARSFYVSRMFAVASAHWKARDGFGLVIHNVMQAARWSPAFVVHALLGAAYRRASARLPRPVVRWIDWITGRSPSIRLGTVRFGDFRRMSPISQKFGHDRGKPIDRYYIETFLAENSNDIRGNVLELHDNTYTQRYGGAKVGRSDILSVEETNPHATIVGDLTHTATLPEGAFDCIILTQALQYIFDLRAAVAALHRALKPGGILLVTTPGITPIEETWPWYWTFTAASLRRLLEDCFGQTAVAVAAHGNILVATAFLHGLAFEELDISAFQSNDSKYPVIITARAIKRK
jgi:glycosyltransferase involved in cell wall biosynthesis